MPGGGLQGLLVLCTSGDLRFADKPCNLQTCPAFCSRCASAMDLSDRADAACEAPGSRQSARAREQMQGSTARPSRHDRG